MCSNLGISRRGSAVFALRGDRLADSAGSLGDKKQKRASNSGASSTSLTHRSSWALIREGRNWIDFVVGGATALGGVGAAIAFFSSLAPYVPAFCLVTTVAALVALGRDRNTKVAAERSARKRALKRQKKDLRREQRELVAGLRQRAEHEVVQALHARWFPDGTHLHQDYAVSFFRPIPNAEQPESWECVVRTGASAERGGRQPHVWRHTDDREELRTAGAVVYTAVEQDVIDVTGIVQEASGPPDPAQVTEYLELTKLASQEGRSWPFASLLTCPAVRRGGAVGLVVVIERKSGLPIEPDILSKDECLEQLMFAAELFMAAWKRTA